MARNIVDLWAEKLWKISPPRNYMPARCVVLKRKNK